MTTICTSPPELSDKQLWAYLDQPESNQEIALHLTRCSYCRQKAETLERFQKTLTSQLYRIDCPSPLELGEYHLRMLPASQMLIIRQHLQECPHCAREVAQLEEFFLGDLVPMGNSLLGQARVLIAKFVSGKPGESAPTFAALRGNVKGPITLEAEGLIIVLDIENTNEGKVNILGQVAADDQDQWTGALVELRQDHELQFSNTVDDLGSFRFEGIPPGSKELRIISKDSSLTVMANFNISI